MNGTEKLKELINGSNNIVFFGGAGVSTESGIPDFRSTDGLYHQEYDYPPETILSHSFFMRNPEEFYRFYKNKMLCLDAKPNMAHKKLAELEKAGKLKAVITQNIDGLHQAAGSKEVLELHGSVHRNYCMKCGKSYDAEYMLHAEGVPTCSCGGRIKPDVVLYEEGLDMTAVALRGMTILPSMIVHFDVSRDKSIKAIEQFFYKFRSIDNTGHDRCDQCLFRDRGDLYFCSDRSADLDCETLWTL